MHGSSAMRQKDFCEIENFITRPEPTTGGQNNLFFFRLIPWPDKKEFKPNKANAAICQIWSRVQDVWNVSLPVYGFQVVCVKLKRHILMDIYWWIQLSAGNHLRIKPCKCIYNMPVFAVKSLEYPYWFEQKGVFLQWPVILVVFYWQFPCHISEQMK